MLCGKLSIASVVVVIQPNRTWSALLLLPVFPPSSRSLCCDKLLSNLHRQHCRLVSVCPLAVLWALEERAAHGRVSHALAVDARIYLLDWCVHLT